jgi:ABC-type nitrate/sulfonate/bicarbonate transport system permease component
MRSAARPTVAGSGLKAADADAGVDAPGISARPVAPGSGSRFFLAPGLRRWAVRVVLVIALLALWQWLAATIFNGRAVLPTPASVVRVAVHDHFYGSDVMVTLWEAARGWLIGSAAATALAALCLFAPWLRRPARLVGTLTYATPTIAIAPFLVILMNPDSVKVAMAGISVFFVALSTTLSGLDSVPGAAIEVIRSAGGSRRHEILKARVPSSLEALADGIALSVPAAILGAIIGEYLGGIKGLGVLLLSSQQNLAIPRTWAVALVSTTLSALAFLFFRGLARRTAVDFGAATARLDPRRHRSALRQITTPFATVVAVIAVWQGAVVGLRLNPYFARTPWATLHYLVGTTEAAVHRSALVHGLYGTITDSAMGWFFGSLVALLLAISLTLYPALSAGVMPGILVTRSVPLIAMTPLLALVFGRGLVGVTLIAAIVTFAPSVVLLMAGLASTPRAGADLMRGLGAGPWTTLRHMRLPFALPSILSAAKISIPGAFLGAILAEWLVTGRGIGHLLSYSITTSNYGMIWAAIAVVGLFSVLIIELFTVLEEIVVVGRARP